MQWFLVYIIIGQVLCLVAMLRSKNMKPIMGINLGLLTVAFAGMIVLWPICLRGFFNSIVFRA